MVESGRGEVVEAGEVAGAVLVEVEAPMETLSAVADRRLRLLASPPPRPLAHARLLALCPVSRHRKICGRVRQ